MAVLALPWSIKPLYGLFTDFVPLRHAAAKLVVVHVARRGGRPDRDLRVSPPQGMAWLLLAMLLVPTIGVAFSDVVIDALMVEEGQPRGITGRLQGVQWAAIYAATILTGVLGGYLSQCIICSELGYLIAGLCMVASFVLVLLVVREPRRDVLAMTTCNAGGEKFSHATGRDLLKGLGNPGILAIGAFIFLWNFNPFSSTRALHAHGRSHGVQRAVQWQHGFHPGGRVHAGEPRLHGVLPAAERDAACVPVDRDGRVGDDRLLGT